MRYLIAFVAVCLATAGCGGSDPPAPAVSGIAATGAPVSGGTITLTCAGGSPITTTTSASGAWTASIAGQTFPCFIKVTGGTLGAKALHSVAEGAGNANVTPMTDLALALALNQAPGSWASGNAGRMADALKALVAALPAALDKLNDTLSDAGYTVPAGDPFSAVFDPKPGDAHDDLLEAIADALAGAGTTYEEFLSSVSSGGTITLPFSDAITSAEIAAMPQLNAATLGISDGVLSMHTGAATSAAGAYVGSGQGNKAVLQLSGMAGTKVRDLRKIVIDMKRDPAGVSYPYPYVAVDLLVDLQCGSAALSGAATIADARARYRIATFDTYYNFIAPNGAASGTLSATTFTALEITPATKGWRVSAGDGTVVGDMDISGQEHGNKGLDFSNFPNACIADAASADSGMFRDRTAAAACDTGAELATSAPASCGKAHKGMTLFLGSSSNTIAATWQVKSISVNDGARSYSFR